MIGRWIRRTVYNTGFVLSYLVFPGSYWFYRATRSAGGWLRTAPAGVFPPFSQADYRVSVLGFMHSANTFVVRNVISHPRAQIYSHAHRLFGIKLAVAHGIKPVVLFRPPREVSELISRRAKTGWYAEDYAAGPLVVAICWLLYHRGVRRWASRVCLVPFSDVVSPARYAVAQIRILGETSVGLDPHPDFSPVNPSAGAERRDRFSWLSEQVFTRGDALYEELNRAAARQQALFDGLPPD